MHNYMCVRIDLIRISIGLFHGERMSGAKPVRCQKCGKPLGYITVFAKGLILSQPVQNVKIVAVCMECFQEEK
jgi:hypothetical protein